MTQVTQTTRRRSDESETNLDEGGDTGATGSLLADLRGGGADGQSDTPMPPRARRKLPTQHLVTLLVFVAGGGALLAMRQYGMGAGMRFDKGVKIDFVENVTHKRTPEQERILVDLERGVSATTPQAADIQKNPFKLVVGPAPEPAPAQVDPNAEANRTAEEKRHHEQDIAAALAGVTLNGVMQGETPLARVNGLIVRVNDKVADMFTVVAIQGRSILLRADDQIFIVEMSDAQSAPTKPAPQVHTRTPSK